MRPLLNIPVLSGRLTIRPVAEIHIRGLSGKPTPISILQQRFG